MANYILTRSDFRESRPAWAHRTFNEVILRLQVMF